MAILNFSDFINEGDSAKRKKIAAGVALIYDNKILLIHPTNSSWKKSTCGIPKGGLEPGEDPFEAALREVQEETGIQLSPEQVDREPHRIDFYNSKNEISGNMIYFVCSIQDLSEVGLSSERVPTSQLQLEEVDWGKFVSAQEAYPIVSREQLIILDRHLSL
jgi:8-oxo-dGTP pyrophosphatase MutT (NUDIX family)